MTATQLFRRLTVLALGGALVACGMLAGIDDFHIGECKGGKCARGDVDVPPPKEESDAASPVADTGTPCVGRATPASIRVGTPPNTFCIESTEVTNADYRQFVEAGVATSAQGANCAWNTDYAPAHTPETLDAGVGLADTMPVTDVDWCDAIAYCQWAGKYLCGRVENGKKTGPVLEEGLADYHSNQWLLACSAEARLRYPYGGVFDPSKCNVRELDAGGLVSVGTTPCIGGYEGLHDMVGNAWEWFDGPCAGDGGLGDAEGPKADQCLIKGASFDNSGSQFDCRLDTKVPREFHGRNVGFRCCSD